MTTGNAAKRVLLRMLATVEALIEKNYIVHAVRTEVISRSIRDLKEFLGPWNSALPSSLALQNYARTLKSQYQRTRDPIELVLLHHLAECLVMVSKVPTEGEGANKLFEQHTVLIHDCSAFFDSKWIDRFRRKRTTYLRQVLERSCTAPIPPTKATDTTRRLF